VTELQQTITRAAVGAIADTLPMIEADVNSVKYLTVEVELLRGKPVEARTWIERRANIGKLLRRG
jgi:hypothetical protein